MNHTPSTILGTEGPAASESAAGVVRPSHPNGYAALKAMLEPYTSEQVARWLMDGGYWPRLTLASAAARVRACTNPDKHEFFKFSEILFLMAQTERYQPLEFAAEVLGRTTPVADPERRCLVEVRRSPEECFVNLIESQRQRLEAVGATTPNRVKFSLRD